MFRKFALAAAALGAFAAVGLAATEASAQRYRGHGGYHGHWHGGGGYYRGGYRGYGAGAALGGLGLGLALGSAYAYSTPRYYGYPGYAYAPAPACFVTPGQVLVNGRWVHRNNVTVCE